MTAFSKRRGFLFTISIIMFASTLVFFAQSYSNSNSANETAIISSARPLNASLLNDDIAFDVGRILDASLDANQGANAQLFAAGTISSSPSISSALSSYNSMLSSKLFPLSSGSKSIDLSSLMDGKAEAFFGKTFEFDYNYSSSIISIFPLASKTLSQLDLNLRVYNDLNRIQWITGAGATSATINLNYYDDSNYFLLSKAINPSSDSNLVLFYNDDSNITLTFGSIGSGVVSALKITDFSGQKLDYSVAATYPDSNIFPINWNAVLHYSGEGFDSNAQLVARK